MRPDKSEATPPFNSSGRETGRAIAAGGSASDHSQESPAGSTLVASIDDALEHWYDSRPPPTPLAHILERARERIAELERDLAAARAQVRDAKQRSVQEIIHALDSEGLASSLIGWPTDRGGEVTGDRITIRKWLDAYASALTRSTEGKRS